MHIQELRRRTTVYKDVSLVSDPLGWSNARVVTVYVTPMGDWSMEAGAGHQLAGFIHPVDEWSFMDFSKLPIEFFNHQLQDYDPSSESSVCSFVATWGFPFLPLRNMASDVSAWHHQDMDRIAKAVERTEEIRELAHALGGKYFDDEYRYEKTEASEEEVEEYGEDYWRYRKAPEYGDVIPLGSDADYYRDLYTSDNEGICDAISFEEAALTLEMLQSAVENIMEAVRGGFAIHARHLDVINMGASFPRLLHRRCFYSGAETMWQRYSLLTSAICNQVIDAFSDPAPWRECACEGCHTVFKRKQSKANAPTSDSVYCCSKCEERQKKRNQRSAARNRIQH